MVLDIFLNIYILCSRQRQIRLLSINRDVFSNFLLMDSSFILLMDLGKPLVDSRFTTRN